MTGQFDQQRLFDPGPEDTTPSFYRRMNREMNPIPGSFKPMSGWPNVAHERFATKADSGNTTDESHLPMFMSAREIMDKYQANSGDLQDSEDERYGEATGREVRTDGGWNFERRSWEGSPSKGFQQRTPNPDRRYMRGEKKETHEQLWNRKYEEATLDRDDYEEEVHSREASKRYDRPGGGETRASGTWRSTWAQDTDNPRRTNSYVPFEQVWNGGESIRDSVLRVGVKSPISLGRQFGDQGKPMIAGGHHRLAVMARERPDTLMPVSHHQDIDEAQSNPHWRYT